MVLQVPRVPVSNGTSKGRQADAARSHTEKQPRQALTDDVYHYYRVKHDREVWWIHRRPWCRRFETAAAMPIDDRTCQKQHLGSSTLNPWLGKARSCRRFTIVPGKIRKFRSGVAGMQHRYSRFRYYLLLLRWQRCHNRAFRCRRRGCREGSLLKPRGQEEEGVVFGGVRCHKGGKRRILHPVDW